MQCLHVNWLVNVLQNRPAMPEPCVLAFDLFIWRCFCVAGEVTGKRNIKLKSLLQSRAKSCWSKSHVLWIEVIPSFIPCRQVSLGVLQYSFYTLRWKEALREWHVLPKNTTLWSGEASNPDSCIFLFLLVLMAALYSGCSSRSLKFRSNCFVSWLNKTCCIRCHKQSHEKKFSNYYVAKN